MTRNQIPGISAQFVDEYFPEAGTGITWFVKENKQVFAYGELLQSGKTICHSGAGGICFWVDPVHELVGCYLSVDYGPITVSDLHRYILSDLFINAATASIVES